MEKTKEKNNKENAVEEKKVENVEKQENNEVKESDKTKSKRRVSIITIAFIILLFTVDFFCGIFTVNIISNEKDAEKETTFKVREKVVPKIYIEGDLSKLETKKDSSNVTFKYVLEGKEIYDLYAKIKLQGTSSLKYDKKNYTVTFFKDEKRENKEYVDLGFSWGEQTKYCFKANWIDSTHSRNIVSARLASQMQAQYGLFEDTPNRGVIDGYPVEIYVNEEYLGLYTCNIPKDYWMFNMDKKNENHIVMGAENNEENTSTRFMSEANDYDWSIEVGPDENKKQTEATYEKFNRVVKFIKDSTDEEFKAQLPEYLNLDACLNYLSFIWLSNGVDNIAKNMMMVTYDGKVWSPSLYDLDTTWGLNWRGNQIYASDNEFPAGYEAESSVLWEKILRCYPEEFKARYNELRQTVLSTEHIISEFEVFESSIPDTCFFIEHIRWRNIPSKDFDFNQIKEYVRKRGEYVDRVVNEL